MRFTLRQLTAFVAVARTSHFGRAAELLGVSQPTVSSDIKSLERAIGVTLLDRSRSGTTLTDAGASLLPHAEALLDTAADFDRAAGSIATKGARPVRLAATPSLVNRLVPEALRELSPAGGTPGAEVVEVPTGGVGAAIAAGDADIGIGHFLDAPTGGSRTLLGSDRLWLLTDKGTLTPETPVELSTMGDRRLLIWPREQSPRYYDFIMDVCAERRMTPVPQESPVRILGAYSYLLTAGEAFAIVPEDFAREAPQSLSCAPLDPPARLPLHAVWKVPAVPGVGELLDVLQRAHRRLTGQDRGESRS